MSAGEVIVEVGPLLTACPGCKHSNRLEAAASDRFTSDGGTYTCEQCKAIWTACPNEDCYGDGPDCPTCGGQTGGLVSVRLGEVVQHGAFRMLAVPIGREGVAAAVAAVVVRWDRDGLAVHGNLPPRSGWAITHIQSGHLFGPKWESSEEAIAAGERILPLGDWTRSGDALLGDLTLERKARQRLYGLWK